MLRHPIIRPFLAGVLLVLFALSITPKLLLHAFVADHEDIRLSITHDGNDQINKEGFHCNIENAVVEVPYLYYPPMAQLSVIPAAYRVYQVRADHQFHSEHPIIFGLRGPPASI